MTAQVLLIPFFLTGEVMVKRIFFGSGSVCGSLTFAVHQCLMHGCPQSGHRAGTWSSGILGVIMALSTGAVVAPVPRVRCLCHSIGNSVRGIDSEGIAT